MHSGVQILNFNLEELRERLHKMPDEKVREFGEAARYMCSPTAMQGKPPLPVYVIQLKEATAEWRRRHPKLVEERPLANCPSSSGCV
jgi:hypothetical protein